MKTFSEIVLPTYLPNLYMKKYNNLFAWQVMIFLYGTAVSLIKLIFYIKNNNNKKKTVDLRLQHELVETTHSVESLKTY